MRPQPLSAYLNFGLIKRVDISIVNLSLSALTMGKRSKYQLAILKVHLRSTTVCLETNLFTGRFDEYLI